MGKKERYCPLCMNTGLDINNKVCSCRINIPQLFDTVVCLDVPEQYRGISFSKYLLPQELPVDISDFMQNMHDEIVRMAWKMHNVLLATPTGSGKTILSYSCLEGLCKAGQETFPVMDVLELKRIVTDMDSGRKQFYDVDNPSRIFSTPVLFAKIPRMRTRDIYTIVPLLLDRRVRRGNSTIFLYDGPWSDLIEGDYYNSIINLKGDGTYNTLDVRTWFDKKRQQVELPEIKLAGNKG